MGVKLISFAPVATASGLPRPSYDIASQTCSNVACHMVPAGTFTYYACGVDSEATLERASFGGTPVTTPPWYSAVAGGCVSCHDNPPDARTKTWHSGTHGGDAAMNECSFCHPDVTSSGGVLTLSQATNCGPGGTFGPCAALHRNGTVEVAPRWRSSCFGCH
ncbi:CxxxxCH/CxxCH domain c-type cytochrome [Anaeromyxobacter diazotrophicus]|uniref:CxxxxCH/CxxCH domain c-type cytochrome n=1 Tax=Anaeromyxobacter diazotrophicus TaxID=2590199 RepID=UPI001591D1F8|nr:hypothetical protein [Anaeromyxobacter diazotrophicus]